MDTQRKRSPIEQGGLEILIMISATHTDQTRESQLAKLTEKHRERYKVGLSVETNNKIWPKPKREEVIVLSDDDESQITVTKRRRIVIDSDSD